MAGTKVLLHARFDHLLRSLKLPTPRFQFGSDIDRAIWRSGRFDRRRQGRLRRRCGWPAHILEAEGRAVSGSARDNPAARAAPIGRHPGPEGFPARLGYMQPQFDVQTTLISHVIFLVIDMLGATCNLLVTYERCP